MNLTNAAIAIVVAFLYVGSIYYKVPSNIRGRDRNDIEKINFRLIRVSSACFFIVLFTPLILVLAGDYASYGEVIREFGLLLGYSSNTFGDDLLNLVNCALLICTLYTGVILKYIVEADFSTREVVQDFREECLSIYGFRDYVFAPFTEELVYRAIILSVLKPAFNEKQILLFSPLLFGVSHIHHGYELYKVRGYDLTTVLVNVLFQATYTNLFGILENYLFLKYSSVWGCTIVHSICNLIGFPDLTIEGSPFKKFMYYATLVLGIFLFFKDL